MNKVRLSQAYVLFVLLAATVISAPPYSLLALALLTVMLFITLRAVVPRLSLAITVSLIFLMPLVVEPALHWLTPFPTIALRAMAAASVLPLVYLLDVNLRECAQAQKLDQQSQPGKVGRNLGSIPITLSATVVAMSLLSLLLGNPALSFTAAILFLYLGGTLLRIFLAIPPRPFEIPVTWRRVIAGSAVDTSQFLLSKASIKLHGRILPVDPWVRVAPEKLALNKGQMALDLTITPPLAGPARPQLLVSAMDTRGFVRVAQLIEPVELHVIPRARYAEWLAKRYLEQAKVGVTATAALPPRAVNMPRKGIEYHDNRSYQPGDSLKHVDWKHTIKSNQLIVKEFIEGGKQAAIIAVNLTVKDAEDADKLAFKLITTALTLAHEGIPAALAAYNYQRVVLTMPVTDPREVLKQALSLVKEIDQVEFTQRCLELPNLANLRRNMARLSKTQTEPAQRLLRILDFERRAIERGAREHPAAVALSSITERTPASAMIVLVSQTNHDAEAIQVITQRLAGRSFTIVPVDSDGAIPRSHS